LVLHYCIFMPRKGSHITCFSNFKTTTYSALVSNMRPGCVMNLLCAIALCAALLFHSKVSFLFIFFCLDLRCDTVHCAALSGYSVRSIAQCCSTLLLIFTLLHAGILRNALLCAVMCYYALLCAVLLCAALRYIALCCTALLCAVLRHSTLLYASVCCGATALLHPALHINLLFNAARCCSALRHCALRVSVILCAAPRCSALCCSTPLYALMRLLTLHRSGLLSFA
jgi:hypothetical protein